MRTGRLLSIGITTLVLIPMLLTPLTAAAQAANSVQIGSLAPPRQVLFPWQPNLAARPRPPVRVTWRT